MINSAARVGRAGFEIFRFEIGHFLQNLRGGKPGSEQVEHITHATTHHANAWASTALPGIYGDSILGVLRVQSIKLIGKEFNQNSGSVANLLARLVLKQTEQMPCAKITRILSPSLR